VDSGRIAAWLLVVVAMLSVVGGLVPAYPDWMTGVIGWLACALFWPRLRPAQRNVALALVAIGAAGIAWGAASGRTGLLNLALTQNMPLVGLLIAVSFLQLVSTQSSRTDEPLTTGRLALLRTLIGVHLFGAVINFSAMTIFADRLSARAKLSVDQATGLSQAFIIGAIWSPFYGAMAVALTFAPGASLTRVMSVGVPLAIAAILITWLTLSSRRHGYAREFAGYPLHLEALWVPFVLAVVVLLVHELKPEWSVLAIIALTAPLMTVLTLLAREGNRTGAALLRLINVRLPEMGGEITLFMSAGMLSAGMAGMIAALDLGVPFSRFGAFEASVTTVALTLAAWAGFHPVILGMVVAPWLLTLNPDPNLLALTVIMPWAIALPGCPMSNTLLALHARYGVPTRELLRRGRIFGAQMLVLCVGVLYCYERLVR
jgi:hypothetical protein